MIDYLTLGPDGRVTDREGKTLELKRDLSSPAGPLRTIVAFANSAGGRLVVGVEDDGTVVGVADPLAEEERVASLISDRISPQLVPAIDLVTLGDATVLVVDVPLSTRRPHYLTRQGPEAGVYVRLGSTTRQADPALVAELERNARGIAFEDLPEPRASLEGLDLASLSDLRGRPTSVDDLLALGLAVRHGTGIVPTNAGILAACPDPTRFLPSAWVQCGRLRGPHGTDIFDQTEIHGPMPLAVDQAMNFLLKHAYKTAVFGEVRRRDVYSIPVEPIREVIVNALVHASYAERGTPIRIGFYDDRIQVDSPGLLLPGMTVETMRRVSRLRNPALARIFREAGIMEQWGTGVQRVFAQVAEAGLPEPVIEEVQDRVRVTIYVPNHDPGRVSEHVSKSREKVESPSQSTKSLSRVTKSEHEVTQSSHQVDSPSGDGAKPEGYRVAILTLLRGGEQTRAEMLSAAGLSNETRNARRHLEPLIESGLVERTIPDKPTSRLQRYRLTDTGRAYLDSLSGGAE
ncbi:ATP-binding protein [Actinomyces bowdenii]|uniref:Putative DNA binding domain-containing protein n=1 Tax=Actinomyces bowdenii TaxID=131109 RepID=A0A853EK37_9ACTO|nr:helix-turn-helix domain-containing protein [Actinomyces bowdenii]MBF0696727.1 putative DNA binding domain-containing protein [Actinomyces bowdenii]NYS68900.1 putative DNA binding domain-containing protein [Actinomyces bowdenii]